MRIDKEGGALGNRLRWGHLDSRALTMRMWFAARVPKCRFYSATCQPRVPITQLRASAIGTVPVVAVALCSPRHRVVSKDGRPPVS